MMDLLTKKREVARNHNGFGNIRRSSSGKLKAISFFSGGGGMTLGFRQAGFEILLATDIEKTAAATHELNFPKVPFIEKDVRTLTGKEILTATGGVKPDIVIGGPPCQGFSTLGDKISADPRNNLFREFARLVKELNPKFVLMENVKAITTMYGGQYCDHVISTFQDVGYKVYHRVLNAADYGIPQIRYRAFFFGTKLDSPFAFPLQTHGADMNLKPYETVGRWIMDLARKNNGMPNHIVLDHSEKVIERYKLIPEGGKLPPPKQLPSSIRRGNFGNTYKRLHRKKPSLTMVPGNNAFPIHPTRNRSLTPREAARLQTFPDKFIFQGDRRRQCILVGNAVPPLLAKCIAKAINAHAMGRLNTGEPEVKIKAKEIGRSDAEKAMALDKSNRNSGKYAFIDLFSGAGGFTIGCTRAGWHPILDVDFDKKVELTHNYNFPSIPFLRADLSDKSAVKKIIQSYKGKNIGMIVGGPPCQGFSIFGKRRFVNTRGYDPHKDPRNRLVFSFVEIVRELKPRWFVMENVPGFLNLDNGYFARAVLDEYKAMGFANVEARILNAADYGVPQIRKRMLMIGNRTGHIIPWPKRKFFLEPQEWQKKYRCINEVIGDLGTKASYDRFSCHVPMNHKPLLVERYKRVPEGGKLNVDELPGHLKKGYRTSDVKNFSHIYKRLDRNKPAWTMVPGHNAFPIHPWRHRSLTVREAARIQTFPDEVAFQGTRQEQCIQVGNAFPPMLAEIIANNIRKAEINNWCPGEIPASATYALVETPKQEELFAIA